MIRQITATILLLMPFSAPADNNSLQNSVNNSAMGGAGGFGGAGGMGGAGGHATGGNANASGGSAHAIGGNSSSISDSDATAHAVGGNAVGGNSTSTASSSPNNSQAITYEQKMQSPSVFLTASHPTAPCQGSLGFFASFIGGLGFSMSRDLEDCNKRETARLAHAIGQPRIAKDVLCMTQFASQTSDCQPQGVIDEQQQ